MKEENARDFLIFLKEILRFFMDESRHLQSLRDAICAHASARFAYMQKKPCRGRGLHALFTTTTSKADPSKPGVFARRKEMVVALHKA
jgi:hypothetical protein